MTQPVRPADGYAFEWRQDRHERILRVAGNIDATAAAHLVNALIDIGSRRLVIDLTEAVILDASTDRAIDEMTVRLGRGRLFVVDRADADPEAVGI